MCKYICPHQTHSRPRVLLWTPLLIRPRPGCGSRAKQAASKLHFLLLSSCAQRHPGLQFSLSCSLPPAPELKWVSVSSFLTSLPLSRHFSAVISQLGESQEGGREGRTRALPCLLLGVCPHMQTGKKGEKRDKSRRETPDSWGGCSPKSAECNPSVSQSKKKYSKANGKKQKKGKTGSDWINLLAVKLDQTPASLTGAFGDGK